jgi:hypothetical protein
MVNDFILVMVAVIVIWFAICVYLFISEDWWVL